MVDLLTATQCLNLLKDDGINYSKSYFSQMVSDGKIRHHSKPPSPKKFFRYLEVKEDIEASKDPTRDEQREANVQKRTEEQTLFNATGTFKSVFDLNEDELREYNLSLEEARIAREEALAAGAVSDNDHDDQKGNSIAANKSEKEYWLGKKAELEVKKMRRELIPVADAKAAVEFIFGPINRRMDEIPHKMRANFNDMTEKQYQWLVEHINRIKSDIDLSVVGEL